MTAWQRCILAFGFCVLAPLLGRGAGDEKTPILDASPSVFLSRTNYGNVSFSPDGKYMTYTPDSQKGPSSKLHVLDVATKKVLHRLGYGVYTFTPDSSRLVCIRPLEAWEPLKEKPPFKEGFYDRRKVPPHQVDVYDVKTGKRLHEIPLRKGQLYGNSGGAQVGTLAVSDKVLVVATKDAVATVYDLETGKTLGDLPG